MSVSGPLALFPGHQKKKTKKDCLLSFFLFLGIEARRKRRRRRKQTFVGRKEREANGEKESGKESEKKRREVFVACTTEKRGRSPALVNTAFFPTEGEKKQKTRERDIEGSIGRIKQMK